MNPCSGIPSLWATVSLGSKLRRRMSTLPWRATNYTERHLSTLERLSTYNASSQALPVTDLILCQRHVPTSYDACGNNFPVTVTTGWRPMVHLRRGRQHPLCVLGRNFSKENRSETQMTEQWVGRGGPESAFGRWSPFRSAPVNPAVRRK